jgi:hypothetical protein
MKKASIFTTYNPSNVLNSEDRSLVPIIAVPLMLSLIPDYRAIGLSLPLVPWPNWVLYIITCVPAVWLCLYSDDRIRQKSAAMFKRAFKNRSVVRERFSLIAGAYMQYFVIRGFIKLFFNLFYCGRTLKWNLAALDSISICIYPQMEVTYWYLLLAVVLYIVMVTDRDASEKEPMEEEKHEAKKKM